MFHGVTRPAAALAALLPLLPGCIKELPRPADPEQVAPALKWPSKPPADNSGRIAVDTTKGHAIVELVEGRNQVAGVDSEGGATYGVGLVTRRLCTTPCTTDLPVGEHELRLRVRDSYELGIVPVKVSETPSAVRVDLGWQDPGHPMERSVGATLLIGGIVTFLTGAAMGLATTGESSSSGWGMSLIGAGMGGFGLWLTIDAGGEIRPTSYTQWDVPAQTAKR